MLGLVVSMSNLGIFGCKVVKCMGGAGFSLRRSGINGEKGNALPSLHVWQLNFLPRMSVAPSTLQSVANVYSNGL